MEDRYLETLEYPKILERLAAHTSFSAGRELALALRPSINIEEVRRRQRETTEACRLFDVRTDITIGGARDIRPFLKQARIGAYLEPAALLDIRHTLISARTLRRKLSRLKGDFPSLAQWGEQLEICPGLIDQIGRCLNEQGEVVDAASAALARIRRDMVAARARLLERLQRIIRSPANREYIQEPIITERSGRYVIPLKAEFKGRIPGIVHDQSSSGATLFIEPLATVELNNRWRKLQLDEEEEIRRILTRLTAQVAGSADLIRRTVEVLAELDLIFARARYSHEIHASEPTLVEDTRRPFDPSRYPDTIASPSPLHLVQARHPLLSPETVVPIDIRLGGDFNILVVTGPNTGGKTVSLKTLGLLVLMAQAGLHIPADDRSRLPVFTGVYADIGDEQSIEQNLSTFSSHMMTIIDILRRTDDRSLVLLDELGAGTDPAEGSALARAIIATLLRRNVLAMVTTHYSELKVYAHNTPGVENASVEFDDETLSPTYVLTIGLPGRSNALTIASRLGLPEEIVEEAKGWVRPEDLETDHLLRDIKAAREAAQAAYRAAQEARSQAEGLQRELSEQLAEIEEARRQILNEARAEAKREVERVKAELRRLTTDLARGILTRERLEDVAQQIEQIEAKMPPIETVSPSTSIDGEELHVGDIVRVKTLDQEGEVIGLGEEEAEVQVGSFRLQVGRNALELLRRASDETRVEVRTAIAPRISPGIEVDLRGWRAEDVIPYLDKYLDNAYLAGLPHVRIIHGKGTGVLRRIVREKLADHPLIASYRAGDRHEGGDGVTIAYFVGQQGSMENS